MTYAHRRSPKKKRVNITLSEDVIDGAKSLGINLSDYIEKQIANDIRTKALKAFYAQHKDAFDAQREYLEEHGTLAERFGLWPYDGETTK